MKTFTLARRVSLEILRDPLTLGFGLGFPLIVLLLLSAIQANIPVSLFEIDNLTPGITVFALSFMTLFSATLLAKDRGSALLQRLYTTPLMAKDFIVGYALPMVPISLCQSAVCYAAAVILGLEVTVNVLWAVLFTVPTALFFVSLGMLFGSILNDKQVGGICGALLTNVSAWFSGTWFDLDLVGGAFRDIAYCLPFAHAVKMNQAVLAGNFEGVFPHLFWVLGYAAAAAVGAVLLFLHQMKRQ